MKAKEKLSLKSSMHQLSSVIMAKKPWRSARKLASKINQIISNGGVNQSAAIRRSAAG